MDTQNLETFVMLAGVKNFTQTAELLFVAQSTVTNRIAELEREVGKRLLERGKRRIMLTAEGEIFLTYAKRILTLEKASLQHLHSRREFDKTLRIGTTNTLYESYLEHKIAGYRQEHPDTAMRITLGHSGELLRQLQDFVLDMVYTYVPLNKKGYCCEVFQEENLVLVTSSENREFQQGISREELRNVDYLMCNFMLEEVGSFLRGLFPPYYQFSFEIDNSTKLMPYLMEGKGYSFLPENLVHDSVKINKLRMIPLIGFEMPVIKSYCVYREEDAEEIFTK